MEKIITLIVTLTFSFFLMILSSNSQADFLGTQPQIPIESKSDCQTLDQEITDLEKEYSLNNKLLASRKQEIEKLPSEATSTKMKLTSDTFMIAAKLETTQNWIKVKRNEKTKQKCQSTRHR